MAPNVIPTWQLYGESSAFPDFLHVEQVVDRAAGLDWTIGAHRHLHLHQLFLLQSGDIRLSLDGEPRLITPPAVVNIPRGTVHGFTFSAGTEGYVLTLPADDFPDLFAAPAETAAPLAQVFTLAANADLSRGFATLAATHAGTSPYRRTRLRAEAAALIAQILEKAQEIQGLRSSVDPRIQRFQTLVRDSLNRRTTPEDLADTLALSPRHLNRLCRAATGLSVQAFVESQKMKEACRLLVYTRMSVQQVAYHLGFDDPAYFSRVFQRNLSLAPKNYRSKFEV